MANPSYSSVTVSNYDDSPPADDGSATEANRVKYATIKNKLNDPLKTALESINTNVAASIASIRQFFSIQATKAGSFNVDTSTDDGKLFLVSGSATASLPQASTAGAGFRCGFIKTDAVGTNVTVDGNNAETVNGLASLTITQPYQLQTVICTGTAWVAIAEQMLDGTAAAPGWSFMADTDTGLYRPAANQIGLAVAGAAAGLIDAGGWTIYQQGGDGKILSLDSSDITHGRTDLAPTSVYGWFQKASATGGALSINGISDTSEPNGVIVTGYGDSPSSAHTTSGTGIVEVRAATVSLTGVTNLGANQNVFVASGRVGGNWEAEFIVDTEGSLFAHDGGAAPTDFDAHNDSALVLAFNDFLGMRGGKNGGPDFDRMEMMAGHKFIGRITPEQWEKGERPLWCVTKVVQLHNGWMCQAVERERIRDEVIEEMLPGFLAKIEERAMGRNVGGIPALMRN